MKLTQKQARVVRDIIAAAAKMGQGSVRFDCYGSDGFKMRCNDTWTTGPVVITSVKHPEDISRYDRYIDFCKAHNVAP